MQSIIYVGINVHKDTYSLCSFDMQKDIFFSQHTMKASTANVASYLKKISESNGNAITVCGYEADPTGYRLCLDLLTPIRKNKKKELRTYPTLAK